MVSLGLLVPLFLVSAVVGVVAADSKRRPLLAVTKPLTTMLLFLIVGRPQSCFAWLIDAGIFFSLVGDVALLGTQQKMFMLGLGSFLLAHIAYIVAFTGSVIGTVVGIEVGVETPTAFWTPQVMGAAGVLALATVFLLRTLWPGAAGLRAPLVAYALALGAMVLCAFAASTSAGHRIAATAAVGAALFYVADTSLALDRFHRPIKHAPVLTLGVYWLGQLGIALAARGS